MKGSALVVGVLGLQGDYQKHQEVVLRAGLEAVVVRRVEDFDRVDRLILPGGESTVIANLLERLGLRPRFEEFLRTRPVWGICAGMILLASQVNDGSVTPFHAVDITVERNGYGRQVFSTVGQAELELNGRRDALDLVFIRAPRVTAVGPEVKVLLSWRGDPVLLAQNDVLVSSFHPELSGSTILHEFFARKFGLKAF